MVSTSKRILVTGATGKQGSGVVKALAAINDAQFSTSSDPLPYTILAVTRSSSASKAQSLLSLRGVELVEGNLDDPEAIFAKAGDVYGVFSCQQSFDNASGGVEGEMKQGKRLADVAVANKVSHFVYTSVDFGHGITEIPHFESKRAIEDYIRTELPTLPLTVLRPTFFMDNLAPYDTFQGKLLATTLVYNFSDASKTIQMIATSDIGVVTAAAFESPTEFLGNTLVLAGDEPTMPELLQSFESVMGKPLPLTFGFLATAFKYAVKEIGTMFKWFDTTGYTADIPVLRQQFPQLKTFKEYLETEVKPKA